MALKTALKSNVIKFEVTYFSHSTTRSKATRSIAKPCKAKHLVNFTGPL